MKYLTISILLAGFVLFSLVSPVAAQSHKAQQRAVKSGSGTGFAQQGVADAILTDVIDELWNQTDEHYHHGEYNHVINLHRIIVQAEPSRVESYANSAWLLWSTDRSEEAVAFLKQGLQANPKNYYMYDELGAHYFLRLKDPKTAISYYEKAVQFPCPYPTLHSLANCYEKTGQWTEAVKIWERAAKDRRDLLAPKRLERARAEVARRNT